jgi:hypothetical protein
MGRAQKLTVAIFFAIVGMLFAVYFSNAWLAGSISFVAGENNPQKDEGYSRYLEMLLASMDQSVSMLTTVQLSLFVLAGFALNSGLRETRAPSATLIVFGGIFVLTALMSLTLGYTARIQALTLIQFGTSHLESVQRTVVSQSILVVLSAVAAVCMMLTALLDRNGTSAEARVQGTTVPSQQPLRAGRKSKG